MNLDLFDAPGDVPPATEALADGAMLLRDLARPMQDELLADVRAVIAIAPLRQFVTPGGLRMSVEMTNCGTLGWVSDRRGYRYTAFDSERGASWPAMPPSFARLAAQAAAHAGFDGFAPDACLINRYRPGTKLSLHQDCDERDLEAPIVSVSLGLPATFLFGGVTRADKAQRLRLQHGDVVVWGGPSRLRFHGVLPLAEGEHALLGAQRINLTFRSAA